MMRFKYYLRGIGIGIIFATCLLSVSFYFGRDSFSEQELSDQEIIERATELGMVMNDGSEEASSEESLEETDESDKQTENSDIESTVDDSSSIENNSSNSEDADVETEPAIDEENLNEAIEDASTSADGSTEESVTYISFTVKSGESSDTVAANLYKAGLVDSAVSFNTYMNELGVDNKIQSGTFYVQDNSTYDDLIALLVNKNVRTTSKPDSQ